MKSINKISVAAFGLAFAVASQAALAEGVGSGSPKQASGVTTTSVSIDSPTSVRPMEGVGSGSPQANSGATTSSYHFRPFAGIRPMEGVGSGSPRSLATTCAAPTSLWTAFACSIFQ
jgi:hypothetical protein